MTTYDTITQRDATSRAWRTLKQQFIAIDIPGIVVTALIVALSDGVILTPEYWKIWAGKVALSVVSAAVAYYHRKLFPPKPVSV